MWKNRRPRAAACSAVLAWALSSVGSSASAVGDELAEKRKGCEAGKAEDCQAAGALYDSSKDKAAAALHFEKAIHLYRQACDRREDLGCVKLGDMYLFGLGVPTDLARAVALYQGPCDRGFSGACFQLGFAHEQGLEPGRPRDMRAIIAAYERTCQLGEAYGHSMACAKLANLYDQGLPANAAVTTAVPRDRARAAVFHQKACDNGEGRNCARLGELYEQGLGVSKDLDRSAALFKKACDLGLPETCQRLQSPRLEP